MMRQILIPLMATSMRCACANVDTKAESKEEKEFVTGSNIPRKDRSGSGVTVMSKEALEGLQRSSGGHTTRGAENLR